MHHTKPYVYKPYPKWVTLEDGNQMIVPNHKQHSALTGIEYDENGNEVVHAQPEAAPVAQPEDSPEYIEGAQAMMDANREAVDPNLAADLAGIFATPEPEAEAVPEKKRRGKPAKE